MRSPDLSIDDDFELTPAVAAVLDELAHAAQAGDAAARNQLYALLAFKIGRFLRAARRYAPELEPPELESEAFLVLADLIAVWPGQDFGRYFLGAFPWRLRRTLSLYRYQSLATVLHTVEAMGDGGEEPDLTGDMGYRLAELAVSLPRDQWRLLCLRAAVGLTMAEIAAVTGLSRRTLHRLWRRTVARLRALAGQQTTGYPENGSKAS